MFYRILNFLNTIKKNPYFIITVLPYAFGTIADQIKSAQLITNKKLILVTPNIFKKSLGYHICNNYLINNVIINNSNQKNYFFIKIFITFFLNIEFLIKRSTAIALKKFFKIKISEANFFPEIGDYKILYKPYIKEFEKKMNFESLPKYEFNKLELDIENDKINFCRNFLKNHGLNIDKKKYVCLHVRDPEYRKDYSRRIIRNSDVEIYKSSIEYLINRGFFVIRIGRISNKRLYQNDKDGFLDYSFLRDKTEFLDLFIIKNCEFFFSGSTSGPLDYAMFLHNKKSLILNNPRIFEAFPTNKASRSSLKKMFWKKNGKKIEIHEYLNLPNKYHDPYYSSDDEIIYQDHNADENLIEVKEYCNFLEKGDFTLSKIQNDFNEKLLMNLRQKYINEKNRLVRDVWFHELTNIYSAKGSFSKNFLQKNF